MVPKLGEGQLAAGHEHAGAQGHDHPGADAGQALLQRVGVVVLIFFHAAAAKPSRQVLVAVPIAAQGEQLLAHRVAGVALGHHQHGLVQGAAEHAAGASTLLIRPG